MDTLFDKIRKRCVSAIADFEMIAPGDRILVACSGGKDSSILLLALDDIRKRAAFEFSIQPVILDQKQPGFRVEAFADWVRSLGLELSILEEDTYSVTVEKTAKGKAYCGLCSRLRRGILYTFAANEGYTKIALGHHRDDLNTTLMMNLFYGGTIKSMPPKLKSDDGRNIVIRPLCYTPESEIIALQQELAFPVIPCNLCGSQSNLQRKKISQFLADWQTEGHDIGNSLMAAQKNVRPSQLADRNLFSFQWGND